ncbi:MAG: hypothetical protein ACP5JP_10690 [bacterium]
MRDAFLHMIITLKHFLRIFLLFMIAGYFTVGCNPGSNKAWNNPDIKAIINGLPEAKLTSQNIFNAVLTTFAAYQQPPDYVNEIPGSKVCSAIQGGFQPVCVIDQLFDGSPEVFLYPVNVKNVFKINIDEFELMQGSGYCSPVIVDNSKVAGNVQYVDISYAWNNITCTDTIQNAISYYNGTISLKGYYITSTGLLNITGTISLTLSEKYTDITLSSTKNGSITVLGSGLFTGSTNILYLQHGFESLSGSIVPSYSSSSPSTVNPSFASNGWRYINNTFTGTSSLLFFSLDTGYSDSGEWIAPAPIGIVSDIHEGYYIYAPNLLISLPSTMTTVINGNGIMGKQLDQSSKYGAIFPTETTQSMFLGKASFSFNNVAFNKFSTCSIFPYTGQLIIKGDHTFSIDFSNQVSCGCFNMSIDQGGYQQFCPY